MTIPSEPAVDRLAGQRYLSLTTFRADGTPVATPVWAARDGDSLVVWTGAGTGKVRRIRRDAAVTLAPCNVRGRLRGEPVDGRAEILPADQTGRVRDLIRRKYGLQARMQMAYTDWRARGRGGPAEVGLRITV